MSAITKLFILRSKLVYDPYFVDIDEKHSIMASIKAQISMSKGEK
jgi:hypothetical protein